MVYFWAGGARSGPDAIRRPLGCRPMAREAPEVVTSDGLKPRATLQSLRLVPTDVLPSAAGLFRVPLSPSGSFGGDGIRVADVASGSIPSTVPAICLP